MNDKILIQKVVCMGDSLTEGYDILPGSSWPESLDRETNPNFINSGVSGDTTAGMLSRFYPMVVTHQPSYVIIMGGTNDLWFGIPQEIVISNIMAMTKLARHHDIISIIGLPPLFYPELASSYNDFFLQAQEFLNQLISFRSKLKEVALSKDLIIIDFAEGMTESMFLADGLHPNESGHRQMMVNAKIVLDALT